LYVSLEPFGPAERVGQLEPVVELAGATPPGIAKLVAEPCVEDLASPYALAKSHTPLLVLNVLVTLTCCHVCLVDAETGVGQGEHPSPGRLPNGTKPVGRSLQKVAHGLDRGHLMWLQVRQVHHQFGVDGMGLA
jgi:hypothetical protein